MSDLEVLRALSDAATPGPWAPFADTKHPLYGRVGCVAKVEDREPIAGGMTGTDTDFIVLAVNYVREQIAKGEL